MTGYFSTFSEQQGIKSSLRVKNSCGVVTIKFKASTIDESTNDTKQYTLTFQQFHVSSHVSRLSLKKLASTSKQLNIKLR